MDNLKKGGAHLDVKEPSGLNDFFEKALEHDFQKLNEPFYIESTMLPKDEDDVPLGIPTVEDNKYISINNLFFHILMEALELDGTTIKSIYLSSRYGYIFQVNLPDGFTYLRNSYLSGGIGLNLNEPLQLLVIKLVVTSENMVVTSENKKKKENPIKLGDAGKYSMTQASFLKETKNQYDINAKTIVTRLSICPDIIDFSLMDKVVATKFLEKMKEKMLTTTTKTTDTNAIDEIIGYLNQSGVTGLGFNVMEFANGFETFASFESNRNNAQLIDSVKYLIAANVVWLYTIGWIHLDLHKWNVMVKTVFNLDFNATTLNQTNLNKINVWFLDMGSMKKVKKPVSSSTSSSSSIQTEQLFVNINKQQKQRLLLELAYINDEDITDETNDTISTIELLLKLSYKNLYPTSNGGVTDHWSENNSNEWKNKQIARFTIIYEILSNINNGAFSRILPIFENLKNNTNVKDQLEQLKLEPGKVLFDLIFELIDKTYTTAYNEDRMNMRIYNRGAQMDYLGLNLLDFNYDNVDFNYANVKKNMISFLFHRLITRTNVGSDTNHVLYRMPDVKEPVQVQELDPYLVSDVSELKAATRELNGKINIDSNGKVSVSGGAILDSLNKQIELLEGKFSLVNETNQVSNIFRDSFPVIKTVDRPQVLVVCSDKLKVDKDNKPIENDFTKNLPMLQELAPNFDSTHLNSYTSANSSFPDNLPGGVKYDIILFAGCNVLKQIFPNGKDSLDVLYSALKPDGKVIFVEGNGYKNKKYNTSIVYNSDSTNGGLTMNIERMTYELSINQAVPQDFLDKWNSMFTLSMEQDYITYSPIKLNTNTSTYSEQIKNEFEKYLKI